MRKRLFLIGIFCLSGIYGWAQQIPTDGPAAQKIKAMKVAFITERLNLTPEESQQFWPLYNEFEETEKAIRQEYRTGRDLQNISEEEADQLIEQHFEMEQRLLDLKKKYFQKFKPAISARKIILLRKAEREFNLELLKRLRERRQGRGNF